MSKATTKKNGVKSETKKPPVKKAKPKKVGRMATIKSKIDEGMSFEDICKDKEVMNIQHAIVGWYVGKITGTNPMKKGK